MPGSPVAAAGRPDPRVLFISPVAFNPYAGGGATFASLFRGWPKDRLATVHNDPNPTPADVCEHYYELGPDELDLVWPLNLLRQRRRVSRAGPPPAAGKTPPAPFRARWSRQLQQMVFGESLPERARLTPALERWIADFRPDVIYTILGGNGMMTLIERIRQHFRLPLVVHIMDDWPSAAHRRGVFAPLERARMNTLLPAIMSQASRCLGISPAMCDAYERRYGRPFTPFQFALDVAPFAPHARRGIAVRQPAEFVYVGSIFGNAQLQSLADLARASAALNADGFPVRLRIVTSRENAHRFGGQLAIHDSISIEPPVADDIAFFRTLADADALVLPVNFDAASIDFIRYSMPTKVPSYLLAGTPVLAYGPPETAQIDYAIKAGWGHVVARRSIDALKQAMRDIIGDMSLRQRLQDAARRAAANHDATVVRTRFQEVLRDAARAPAAEAGR